VRARIPVLFFPKGSLLPPLSLEHSLRSCTHSCQRGSGQRLVGQCEATPLGSTRPNFKPKLGVRWLVEAPFSGRKSGKRWTFFEWRPLIAIVGKEEGREREEREGDRFPSHVLFHPSLRLSPKSRRGGEDEDSSISL